MKLVKACIAMAAFAALCVVPSVASATTLTSPTGTAAAVGTLIQGTNVAHSTTEKVTVMTTSLGNIECATATLTGKVVVNNGTHVVGTIETVDFKGTPAAPTSAHCTAPGGFGTTTVTPSHTSDFEHQPVGGVKSKSLPWCITAGGKDEFSVWGEEGGSCTSGKTRPLTFALHTSLLGTCVYSKATVTGTYTTHPAGAIATINKQKFERTTGSGFCPASGELDMAFTLETHTATPSDVYIDAI